MALESTQIPALGHESVIKFEDKQAGLVAIVAIHSTVMGPALGGTRIYPYTSEEQALKDVLRLSEGMTYKSSIAKAGFGGGKSVILLDPVKGKTPEMLRAFGRAVQSLGGQYICAEDVGCTTEDVGVIRMETEHVVGLDFPEGSGNPAPFTARGVYRGIQSALYEKTGSRSVAGKKIAIQGLGSVGQWLARYLFWEGAELVVTDINAKLKEDFVRSVGADWVEPDSIYEVECDVFAPCAMGGVINEKTVARLKTEIVAGAANNQLDSEQAGEMLHQKGVLYVPDFVINAGGLINVSSEGKNQGYNARVSRDTVDQIFDTLLNVYDLAKKSGTSTQKAAMQLAARFIEEKKDASLAHV